VVEFNFADNYRAAGLAPGPDILRTRQDPFDKLRRTIDFQTAIDLTRLYFELPVPRGTDWFRDSFGATDPSFSLIDNAREAAVLAAGLLEAAAADGKVYAALAILTTSASGLRQPLIRPELVDAMRNSIQAKAVTNRQQAPIDPSQIKLSPQSGMSTELTALVEAPDIAKVSSLLKQVSEESTEITKTLTSQVLAVVKPLAAEVVMLREEVEMLWWHVGGWSRLLEKPFAELDLGLAAVLAGVDMADMSRSATGPAAAPAIFQRTLLAGSEPKTTRIALKDAVDAIPQEKLDQLLLADALGDMPDICPVLTAFAKAKVIGAGSAWHAPFVNATGLGAESAFAPLELAMQAYRERLLLRALN
jgi:hypothetical protein